MRTGFGGLSAIALVGVLAAPASAAGFADFEGFYAGVLGSAVGTHQTGEYQGVGGPGPDVIYDFTLTASGGGLGGLVGYQWPWQQFVFAVEGDASLLFGATDSYVYTAVTPNRADMVSVSGLGHVRGLVGFPVSGFVPFLAGGIALANVTQSHIGPDPSTSTTWSETGLQLGASIGVGVSVAVADNITLRLEGLADIFPAQRYDWTVSPVRYTDSQLSIYAFRAGLIVALP